MEYKSSSSQSQDLFVLAVTNCKRNGTYFEVGSHHPIYGNNTYLLENQFGWTGVSIDIAEMFVKDFNNVRKNPCVCLDATVTDLTCTILEHGFGPHIDFLQLDIDPYFNTFKALHNIDFDQVSFSVIAYEHDAYRGGLEERKLSREFLKLKGYTLVVADVCQRENGRNLFFEDWYVNEKYMPSDNWKKFQGEGIIMNEREMLDVTHQIFKDLLLKRA
jgi:hypothetical protein